MRRHSYIRKGTRTIPEPTGGGPIIVTPGEGGVWSCPADLPLLSLVYVDSSNHVDKANASSTDTMMSIGFVSSKNGTSCSVQSNGELSGFSGLLPGKTYYASSVAGAIWTPTEESLIFPLVVQVVGTAKTDSILLVNINPGPFVLVPSESP